LHADILKKLPTQHFVRIERFPYNSLPYVIPVTNQISPCAIHCSISSSSFLYSNISVSRIELRRIKNNTCYRHGTGTRSPCTEQGVPLRLILGIVIRHIREPIWNRTHIKK
jgi:hypothetical protein